MFWFTLEFGVLWEAGELKTYGAGILSSFGEIDVFSQAEMREWGITAMGSTSYDITTYQPVLFAARSFAFMVDQLGAFFETFDDDGYEARVSVTTTTDTPGRSLPRQHS